MKIKLQSDGVPGEQVCPIGPEPADSAHNHCATATGAYVYWGKRGQFVLFRHTGRCHGDGVCRLTGRKGVPDARKGKVQRPHHTANMSRAGVPVHVGDHGLCNVNVKGHLRMKEQEFVLTWGELPQVNWPNGRSPRWDTHPGRFRRRKWNFEDCLP